MDYRPGHPRLRPERRQHADLRQSLVAIRCSCPDGTESVGPPLRRTQAEALLRAFQILFPRLSVSLEAPPIIVDVPPAHADEVADDGRGFDVGSARAGDGFGLTNMQERARRIGARFTVRSDPGRNTSVLVSVPRSPGPEAPATPREPS